MIGDSNAILLANALTVVVIKTRHLKDEGIEKINVRDMRKLMVDCIKKQVTARA